MVKAVRSAKGLLHEKPTTELLTRGLIVNAETTEESKPQSNEEEITRLAIDRPSDFRFHAAYIAYSETWDKTDSPEIKTKLNDIISSLSNDKISYSKFYRDLGQYRDQGSKYYARRRVETQRKRDWRKRRAKDLRNARHRKKH
ncbi:hypothetical protein GWN65_02680 [Candidatus Bathyarchaeota archaeon]|nr:hypothetical protein [Candidatus Bathyarchaeota archaeon]NIV43944.1 hypothetical protein [Candidatus Bathyarchaeota archaeon]